MDTLALFFIIAPIIIFVVVAKILMWLFPDPPDKHAAELMRLLNEHIANKAKNSTSPH